MDPRISLASMPMVLRWDAAPVRFETEGAQHARIVAGPKTDLFVDPGGDVTNLSAPRLIGRPPDGDFVFSARVNVQHVSTYDAGVLLVWADEERWAKLCFERSPDGGNMVVSVVNRRSSDDANAFVVDRSVVDGSTVWLRIARLGRAIAFHASLDGEVWRFVRHFDLGVEAIQIGFEAQSPVGPGCTVTFDEVTFSQRRLSDLRDGS